MGFKYSIYSDDIFNSICKQLYQESPKSAHNLYRNLGIKTSKDTFYNHHNKLLEDSEIQSIELESNRNIKRKDVSLTDKGRKRFILKISKSEIGKRERAYCLILYYLSGIAKPRANKSYFSSNEELNVFLFKKYNTKLDDFTIERINPRPNNGKTTIFAKKVGDTNINIIKNEYRDGNGHLVCFHVCRVGDIDISNKEGISVDDFLHGGDRGEMLENVKLQLSEEEVGEYFRLLCEAGILKEVIGSDYQKRYDIVNEEFRLVIMSLAAIQGTSLITSNKIWNTLANPTKEDRKWYKNAFGQQRENIHLAATYEALKAKKNVKNRDLSETKKLVKDWGLAGIEHELQELYEQHQTSMDEYSYIIEPMLEIFINKRNIVKYVEKSSISPNQVPS